MAAGKRKKRKVFSPIYLTLVLIVLYLPILMVVLYSFNAGRTIGSWQGFTTDEAEIGFYKSTFLQAAWMAGTKKDEAEDAFFAFGRHINFTVCRASYMAMAQYLYMAAFFSEKGGKKEKGLCMYSN